MVLEIACGIVLGFILLELLPIIGIGFLGFIGLIFLGICAFIKEILRSLKEDVWYEIRDIFKPKP